MDWNQTLERVREAADFCRRSGLARLRIEDDELTLELHRTPRAVPPVAAAPATADLAAVHQNGVVTVEPREDVLRAEFVGIVRFSRPAVVAGTQLPGDREVAYVESLGIRNPIRTVRPGRVVAIHVTDGEPVEYGQALFAIAPDA